MHLMKCEARLNRHHQPTPPFRNQQVLQQQHTATGHQLQLTGNNCRVAVFNSTYNGVFPTQSHTE